MAVEEWLAFPRCRAAFDEAVLWDIRVAKRLFQASVVLPLVAYMVGGPLLLTRRKTMSRYLASFDARPRFPTTISWTVRRGPPRHLFHVVWLAGWARLLWPLARRAADCGSVLAFLVKMVLTGVVGLTLAPVGVSKLHDDVHHASSLVYMCDHYLLCRFLHVQARYTRAFLGSLAAFLVCTLALKVFKRRHKCLVPPHASNNALHDSRAKLTKPVARALFLIELAEMVAEYAIFAFFIGGLDSGLTDDQGLLIRISTPPLSVAS